MNEKDLALQEGVTLRALSHAARLPIGTAIDPTALDGSDPRYADTLRREFNLCVAENAFKPSEVWIGPREYDFSHTDRLVEFARENDLQLRGHTLVWHQQTPRWLDADQLPATDTLRELLRDYIHALVGRYKGQITYWDVVNEAVEDTDADGAMPGLREESVWYRAFGATYLRWAFDWAHEADPDARLYYNDYEIENLGPKSNAVYTLLRFLRADGVPVHGVGFQGHLLNGWRLTEGHRENVRRFVALGLDWMITEADIRMELPADGTPTPEQLSLQAEGYGDLTRWCRTEPRCQGLVFWGFTDAYSWIPDFRTGWGAALPFDAEYRPKPAYQAIAEGLL